MADLWFYSHGQEKLGPCTDRQMRDLADAGEILPGDTVWKQGVTKGVLANKVKNLFPPLPPVVGEPPAPLPPAPVAAVVLPPVVPEAVPAAAPAKPAPSGWNTNRKGNAVAGRGAVLVGQDGVNVKFRKKCTTCEHLDSSWNTVPIRNGVTRVGFFCPKCRKHREVEIHGSFH